MLAQHPFLTGLEPGYLEFMSQEATIVTFDSDQHILLEGREANDFYLIHQGEVALKTFLSPSEGFAKIQQLSAGDIIGWSWFVSPYHWQFSAFATKPTTVIALDGKRLRDKSEADHEFGYALQKRLLPVIGQRLQMTKKGLD
jgi:CRP-like cAMP-binding protein